jgi:type IV secretory pathway VirB3-like protein
VPVEYWRSRRAKVLTSLGFAGDSLLTSIKRPGTLLGGDCIAAVFVAVVTLCSIVASRFVIYVGFLALGCVLCYRYCRLIQILWVDVQFRRDH